MAPAFYTHMIELWENLFVPLNVLGTVRRCWGEDTKETCKGYYKYSQAKGASKFLFTDKVGVVARAQGIDIGGMVEMGQEGDSALSV